MISTAFSTQRSAASTPVRGTQSFVGVMAEVWKRPSLTALEIAWRWAFWALVLGSAAFYWRRALAPYVVAVEANAWSFTSFDSSAVLHAVRDVSSAVRSHLLLGIMMCLGWILLSAWGRGKVLQRLDYGAAPAFVSLSLISGLRVACLLAVIGCWLWAMLVFVQRMVVMPLSLHHEPAFVPFAAIVIVGTLGLFVLWMAASYVFHLAPVLCVQKRESALRSLRESLRRGTLRGKLVEINLVVGITKIALLVLALVFSACPLPFSSVETQTFLTCWWIAVGLWYAVASDYIHVVRTAAFLRLWQLYEKPVAACTSAEEIAS